MSKLRLVVADDNLLSNSRCKSVRFRSIVRKKRLDIIQQIRANRLYKLSLLEQSIKRDIQTAIRNATKGIEKWMNGQ